MDDFWIIVIVFGCITIIGLGYLIFLFYSFVNDLEHRLGRNQFYQGVITIIKNNEEIKMIISELQTLFKENSKRNPKVYKKYPTLNEILEDFIYNVNTIPHDKWKKTFKIEYPGEYRSTLISISNEIKRKNPYNNFKGRSVGMLYKLIDETQINDEVKDSIQELIDDLEVSEYQDREGFKLSKTSYYYTIVFGVIGLIGTIYTFVSPFF